MAKNVGAGPGSTKPGCQNRTKNAGDGPRVNPPSLNDNPKYRMGMVAVAVMEPRGLKAYQGLPTNFRFFPQPKY